jgi:hypothetical protein
MSGTCNIQDKYRRSEYHFDWRTKCEEPCRTELNGRMILK